MKVFAVALVAAVLIQVALAAPGRRNSGCGCSDESDETHHVSSSDRLLIQRMKGGHGRTQCQAPVIDESSEECGCGSKGHHWNNKETCEQSEEDDCTQVSKPQVVRTSGRCEENEKIYLHRQAPIYVRPPPSRIFINHPPVVVRQPPVILHHQSRSPVLVKPILIKERETAARPVLFKISRPDSKVCVSKCEPPKVHVESCCKPSCPKPSCPKPSCSSGCSCPRKECC